MKFNRNDLGLYLVTDQRWLHGRSLAEDVRQAILGGVTMVQLREKELNDDQFIEIAKEIKALCQEYRVPFIINDNIQVALAVDADGVHVGQSDMEASKVRELIGPDKILGVSAHNIEEGLIAKANGADYLGIGAMFTTTSKEDATLVSMETMNAIMEATQLPAVAIGGISIDNLSKFKGTSIDGIAVISAILAQENIYQAAYDLRLGVNTFLRSQIKKVLTIAGSDSSGGAGIQADLKTMCALHTYGMSAITALTAQNTTGVYGIMDTTPDFLKNQLDCIFTDIYPDAIKIGMVSQPSLVDCIADQLIRYKAKNIVLDPVMVSTSGSQLMQNEATAKLLERLIPLADIITPNLSEAEVISQMKIQTKDEMILAAKKISQHYSGYILIKGGHFEGNADDLVYYQGTCTWLSAPKLNNPNTHGTGCTLSSAIACFLAKGESPMEAIIHGKEYVYQAIAYGMNLGNGRGPLHHLWNSK
ncbi:bifunctional hydroxymethylpyrimidine kinase/phosphomethylpyrimidine kinase [Beduini massiliensis]|uniref:bifunctional hydroxymethylpyrimidine kinase/phosphomethylpyrimidine kinase n=1 Tax=Beduini massiliensis TaxID=1585974 RepID=UPI00059A8261